MENTTKIGISVEKRSDSIDRRVSVAPMMDWTDRHCRYFLRQFSASALLYTEMIHAAAIIRGGGSSATELLRTAMGEKLLGTMLPGIDRGLRLFDNAVVVEALRAATNIDFAGLRDDVTAKASDAVYRAIGREEIAIRADPASTNDPLLIAVFRPAK